MVGHLRGGQNAGLMRVCWSSSVAYVFVERANYFVAHIYYKPMDTSESPLCGVAIDVVLLAVVIALHATKRDQNLKLLLVFLIVVHVITTTRCGIGGADSIETEEAEEAVGEVDSEPRLDPQGTTPTSTDKRKKSASDAQFNRQLSSPEQLSKTHDILPTTSEAANAKLVNARTRFFKDIV